MYEPGPNVAELAAFGLTLEDMAADQVEVWPGNVQAFDLFADLASQWREGMSGPTGLDYNVMFRKMDRMSLTPAEYDALEDDIQVMERAALRCMHKKS